MGLAIITPIVTEQRSDFPLGTAMPQCLHLLTC